MNRILKLFLIILLIPTLGISQNPLVTFDFEKNLSGKTHEFEGSDIRYVPGIDGQALSLRSQNGFSNLKSKDLIIDESNDFSIQFWVQTHLNEPTVLLGKKKFLENSIRSQKNPGWVLYVSGGNLAWSVGSGSRRLNYEIKNGDKIPVNDGLWHLITMTFNKNLSEVRLYYDGHNKAIYKVGFDFTNNNPLVIGSEPNKFDYDNQLLPQIKNGAIQLQALVDEFNALEIENLADDEFIKLIVDPEELFLRKREDFYSVQPDKLIFKNIDGVKKIRNELLKNPYTVFQNLELTLLKPISKIYYLDKGKVKIHLNSAKSFTQQTQLFPSEFNIDNLSIWDKTLTSEEVLSAYNKFRNTTAFKFEEKKKSLNVGVWNIWHGGKHFTVKDHNWDSQMQIVKMIQEKELDVLLLQETYSSGALIASELGYYFATTSDWDYCFQGSNVSVISRYPIEELYVPLDASFMNVAAKVILSKTQEIYAMSNWYGMDSFPIVYNFHQNRFKETEKIPVFFGGDFNAVPNTDGGDNVASVKMLENGFTDAYRSLHPNLEKFPGYTHAQGARIDQLYFKGDSLTNTSTEVISSWAGGFPSDHGLLVAKFELNY